MNSADQGIARARPVSSARRKISMEMGLQHSRTRSLKCPPEYTRTRSEPNLYRLIPGLSATAASAHHGPSDFDGALIQHTAGGSDPILASNVLQPVTTELPSPLPPVFSALSTAPLQPQPLGTTTPTSPSATSTPASPTTTSDTNEDNGNEVTDKYAALANLDAAFSDPTNTPATTVNWSMGEAQSSDDEPDAVTSGRDGTQSRNIGVTSPEHHRQGAGAGAGINWNGTAGSNVPTTTTTPTAPTVDDNEAVDKYAALAGLATDPAMSVDWGRSQSADQESTADGPGPNSTTSPNPLSAGSSAGVTSPSSQSSGPQTATAPVMLASGTQLAPVLADTNGYYNPATQYGLSANGQPCFGLPANGQPCFGLPANGQPCFGLPANGQPCFGLPANGQPSFGLSANCQPSFGLPANGQPSFGLPAANGQPNYGLSTNGQPGFGLSTNDQPGYGFSAAGQPGFGPTPFGNVMYGYQQIPTHNTSCPSTFSPVGFEGFSAHMDAGSQRFPAQMETGVPHITSASSSSNPFIVSSPMSGHTSVCQS